MLMKETLVCVCGWPGDCSNTEHPTEIQHKSCKILSVLKLFLNSPIVLKFCTEHGSDTAVLCEKFQKDWADVNLIKNYASFEFEDEIWGIPYVATVLRGQGFHIISLSGEEVRPTEGRKADCMASQNWSPHKPPDCLPRFFSSRAGVPQGAHSRIM